MFGMMSILLQAEVLEYLKNIFEEVYGPLPGSASKPKPVESFSGELAFGDPTCDQEVNVLEGTSALQQSHTPDGSASHSGNGRPETAIGDPSENSAVQALSGLRKSDDELSGFSLVFHEEDPAKQCGIHSEVIKSTDVDIGNPSRCSHSTLRNTASEAADDVQAEISDFEMLKYFPDVLPTADKASGVGACEVLKSENSSGGRPAQDDELTAVGPVTPTLNFEFSASSAHNLLTVSGNTPADIQSSADDGQEVQGASTSIDEGVMPGRLASCGIDSLDSSISCLAWTTSAAGGSWPQEKGGVCSEGLLASAPEHVLPGAVPGVTEVTASSKDTGQDSAANWSKGALVESTDGSHAQVRDLFM